MVEDLAQGLEAVLVAQAVARVEGPAQALQAPLQLRRVVVIVQPVERERHGLEAERGRRVEAEDGAEHVRAPGQLQGPGRRGYAGHGGYFFVIGLL
ncbi:hypothetical protein D3C81_1222030 [compost metagenome]